MSKDTDIVFMSDDGSGLVSLYSAEREDTIIRLRYHKDDSYWSDKIRNKVAIEAIVKDEYIEFETFKGTKFKLDYSEIEEMAMMLNYLNENSQLSRFVSRYKKFKEI